MFTSVGIMGYNVFKMADTTEAEESLATLCREAEQLKNKIEEEKKKYNDLARK